MKRISLFAVLLAITCTLNSFAQSKKKIEVLHADAYNFNEARGKDIRVMVGNVELRHRDALMYCDSVIMDDSNNGFDAYGNVHIIQGDSLDIYSNILFYDGLTRLARLRKNVKMINKGSVLTTEKLNYDMNDEVGYYFDGGQIQDSLNLIVSNKGTYYPDSEDGFFRKDVVLTTEDFILESDTVYYNTDTKYARFDGPSKIYNDTTTLLAEEGYYESLTKYAFIYDNASIDSKQYYVEGDTLIYNQQSHDGYALGNSYLRDTAHQIIFTGNHTYFNDSLSIAHITDSALMMAYSEDADTLFLHGDSLTMAPDTAEAQIMRAFYNVKYYRSDIQGKCDSMAMNQQDSIIKMYGDPILWSGYNQLSAEEIQVFNKNGTADRVELYRKGFIISQEDSVRFNQIKGKKIIGYVQRQALRKIFVDGNAQSVFYTKDDGYIVGVNKAESSYLTIYLEKGSVDKLVMTPNPEGNLYPPSQSSPDIEILPDFNWFKLLRPKSKWDIFYNTLGLEEIKL